MKVNKRDFIVKLSMIIVMFITLLICYKLYNSIENNFINDLEKTKILVSWFGIIIFGIIICSWYAMTKEVITSYIIFMMFFFLFNFGQCILWAFGIHSEEEIGTKYIYTIGVTSNTTIIKTQLLVIACMICFHVGSIFCYKGKHKEIVNQKKDIYRNENMYKVNCILAMVIIPATFINLIHDLFISRAHGYSALYYGEYANSGNTLIILIAKMFIPCLIGLLIGSNYNRKTRIMVYSIYSSYIIIDLLCGDRGGWIFGLVILFWLHHNYVKKFNIKRIITFGIIGFIALSIIYAIVEVRDIGINIENIADELSTGKNPIVEAITEMGGSMGVSVAIVQNKFPQNPYGNTYVFSVLGMVTERLISFLGIDYIGLSTWFSQIYLKINYGAGFSIVAEALLNFGPYIAPFTLIIQGYIITSTLYTDKNKMKNNKYRSLFAIASLISWIPITRGTMQFCLKNFFYTVIVYFCLYNIVLKVFKTINKNKQKYMIEEGKNINEREFIK